MMHVMLAAVAVPNAVMAASWVYANPGETQANAAAQEATWGGQCVTGREQSPVDIITAEVAQSGDANIITHYSAALKYLKNTGKGFQLFETSPKAYAHNATTGASEVDALGSPKGYAMINGERYNFYQVHWHSPSENTIDGVSYPLEAHFVHQLDDVSLHGTYHRLAVIGLLYELGECNEFLDSFWSQFPQMSGIQPYSGPALDFNTKLTQELEAGYYHWFGSLTTPPCTEGVSWNLLKVKETVCQRQIDAIQTALGATQSGIRFNNRVTMPLNHRTITETGAAHAALSVDSASTTSETSEVSNVVLLVLAAVIMALVVALLTLFVFMWLLLGEVRGLLRTNAKSGAKATTLVCQSSELEKGTCPSGASDTHPSGSDLLVKDGDFMEVIGASPPSVAGAKPVVPRCSAPGSDGHPSASHESVRATCKVSL